MLEDTELWYVDDRAMLERTAEALSRSRVIGIDTEGDSFHHYREKVCLIQFSDLDRDYIIDPLALKMDLEPLAPLFANRKIVKILHGGDYDVVSLKRDFDFEIHNLFDTMIAAQMIGMPRIGLADLLRDAFDLDIEKKYQRHDWSRRPLRPEHLQYARGDTHWLLALRELLLLRLNRVGRLDRVIQECRLLEKREWEGRTFDDEGYLRVKGCRVLDDTGLRILRRAWLFRDDHARSMDRPAFKVLPDHVLVEVAKRRPSTNAELDGVFPRKGAMKRKYGAGLLDAVVQGLEDDFEVPSAPTPKRKRAKTGGRLRGSLSEQAFAAMKDWRNAQAEEDGLPALGIAANGVLKSIVRSRPYDLEELRRVPDVRQWQVDAYGEAMLRVLDAAAPREAVEAEAVSTPSSSAPKRRRRRRSSGRSKSDAS
jgi:ribonuclease D